MKCCSVERRESGSMYTQSIGTQVQMEADSELKNCIYHKKKLNPGTQELRISTRKQQTKEGMKKVS